MAVTLPLINKGIRKLADSELDWATGTWKCALITSTWTPAQATDEFFSTPEANEVSQTGYTAGGIALTTVAPVISGQEIRYDSTTNPQWTITGSVTARYAVIYKELGGASSADPLVAYVDFGQDETATDDTFTITWAANSVFKITVT